ncbi:MAG: type II secretion system F family protein, partial [Firmicutes bacterium]|nr:type II secretion system F family protein [Bacillota bacterium]
RMMKKRKQSFERELPNMIFRFILLLNAGMIAEGAFSQLVEQTSASDQPLYRAMRDIKAASLKKNVSFISELSSYAKRSGSPDLLRFASMAEEHAGRGSELADKLEKERAQMRSVRMLAARARVKEAETKLCFPLVLLLLALILITAAPSFLAM